MAESLSAEQLEERRTNLRAFRKMLEMDDDADLTTTLIMQEEWLATVDELQTYVRDAYILRGLRTRTCLLRGFLNEMGEGEDDCTDVWKDNRLYCAPCYLRATHEPVTEDEEVGDTDELLRRHWQSEAFDPEGEGVTEGWPDNVSWREQFEARPVEGEPTRYKSVLSLDKFAEFTGCCLTCGAAPNTFVDGDCPQCNPMHVTGDDMTSGAEFMTECETIGQAHVWVKVGTVGLTDKSLSAMDWGDPKCLRCGIPEQEKD